MHRKERAKVVSSSGVRDPVYVRQGPSLRLGATEQERWGTSLGGLGDERR